MRKALTTLTAALTLVGAPLSAGAHQPVRIDLAMVDPVQATPSNADSHALLTNVSSRPASGFPTIIHGPGYLAPLRMDEHFNRPRHDNLPADDRFELR